MRAQLVCVVLLALASCSLCSGKSRPPPGRAERSPHAAQVPGAPGPAKGGEAVSGHRGS